MLRLNMPYRPRTLSTDLGGVSGRPADCLHVALRGLPDPVGLRYAFYEWRGLERGEFVGLANFIEVLFGATMAPVVWNAFWHNVLRR